MLELISVSELLILVPLGFISYSLCSGAEYLLQIVFGAIPQFFFEVDDYVPAADIAVHILNHLYLKLNEVCLVQGGEVIQTCSHFIILISCICDCWV